jgi:hypothetical protein
MTVASCGCSRVRGGNSDRGIFSNNRSCSDNVYFKVPHHSAYKPFFHRSTILMSSMTHGLFFSSAGVGGTVEVVAGAEAEAVAVAVAVVLTVAVTVAVVVTKII